MATQGERIRQRRKLMGFKTQVEFARSLGIPQQTIVKFENNILKHSKHLPAIARALQTTVEWLQTGKSRYEFLFTNGSQNVEIPMSEVGAIWGVPVIEWEEAGHTVFRGDDVKNPKARDYFQVQARYTGLNAFALRMKGDAMQGKQGEISFLNGDILVFDPDKKPKPGDYVLARIKGESAAIFRLLVSESNQLILRSANIQYPIIPLSPKISLLATLVTRMTLFK